MHVSSDPGDAPFVVLTTVGSSEDAVRLATAFVEQQLAACVNILSGVRSVYAWEGKVVDEDELMLVMKTTRRRLDALKSSLLVMHPYDIPEFVVIAVDRISEPYHLWLVGATGATTNA